MFTSIIEEATLTGIEAPKELSKPSEAARGKLEDLRAKLKALREKADAINLQALRAEAVTAIAEGKDPAALKDKIREAEADRKTFEELAVGVAKLVEQAEAEAAQAEAQLSTFLRGELDKARLEMHRQLTQATNERGRSSSEGDGKWRSSPPKTNSKSRIAVCERCHQPVGTFDPKTIRQPITGKDFAKLSARMDRAPFRDVLGIADFKCWRCGGVPFLEADKFLTNAGFYAVKPGRKVEVK